MKYGDFGSNPWNVMGNLCYCLCYFFSEKENSVVIMLAILAIYSFGNDPNDLHTCIIFRCQLLKQRYLMNLECQLENRNYNWMSVYSLFFVNMQIITITIVILPFPAA